MHSHQIKVIQKASTQDFNNLLDLIINFTYIHEKEREAPAKSYPQITYTD
jgi:hypothetical protein